MLKKDTVLLIIVVFLPQIKNIFPIIAFKGVIHDIDRNVFIICEQNIGKMQYIQSSLFRRACWKLSLHMFNMVVRKRTALKTKILFSQILQCHKNINNKTVLGIVLFAKPMPTCVCVYFGLGLTLNSMIAKQNLTRIQRERIPLSYLYLYLYPYRYACETSLMSERGFSTCNFLECYDR